MEAPIGRVEQSDLVERDARKALSLEHRMVEPLERDQPRRADKW